MKDKVRESEIESVNVKGEMSIRFLVMNKMYETFLFTFLTFSFYFIFNLFPWLKFVIKKFLWN